MSPDEYQKWLKSCSLTELIDSCIWQAIMEGTAHCGWTDNARDLLVKHVQENVQWAIEQKLDVKLNAAAEELLEFVIGFLGSAYGPEQMKMIWKRLEEIDPELNPRSLMRKER